MEIKEMVQIAAGLDRIETKARVARRRYRQMRNVSINLGPTPLNVGGVVTTKRTNRRYQVVGWTSMGPIFRFLKEVAGGVELHGPTLLLNPRRYIINNEMVQTHVVSTTVQ